MNRILNKLLLVVLLMIPSVVLAKGSVSSSVSETVKKGNNVTFTVKVREVNLANIVGTASYETWNRELLNLGH